MTPKRLLIMVPAAALAASAALAQDEDLSGLTEPSSTISAGAGHVSDDNRRFGQYTGMTERGIYPLVDFSILRRDNESGQWIDFSGRNLGLDSRELRFENRRQGDWGYFIDYNQIPRASPYTARTAVQGIGTNSLTIPYPAATSPKRDVELETRRDILTLGGNKLWAGGWDFQLRFRNEEKNGERIFSRGTTGGTGGHEFTPEPIDYQTRQVEATLGYTGERLQMSGGYYGSFFTNRNPALYINNQPGGPAALGTGAGAFTPIGLPPSNQSHQFHVAGGYGLTPTTRATFKLAYANLTQDETFIIPAAALSGRTDLGGRIDTTQAQLGITSRPFAKLSLRADARYENRDDKTPEALYQTFNAITPLTAGNSPTATTNGLNEPRSIKTKAGKLEGTYSLPAGFRMTAGADYEDKQRNTNSVRSVSHRYETEEITLRTELRRSLSETVNGAIGYAHSQRDGSDWLNTITLNGANGSNLVSPLHLADRKRDKVRGVLDWAPLEPLSLHFVGEAARDEYGGRTLGPREGRATLYSADAAYTFSDRWSGTAWVSQSDTRAEQRSCENAGASNTGTLAACPNTAADPIWQAKLRAVTDAIGVGLRGKPSGVLQLGADLVYARDRNEFEQGRRPVPAPIGTPLADVHYTRLIASLSARYSLSKDTAVQLRYAYDRFTTDDYNWSAWAYTDGTRLNQQNSQNIQFVGVALRHEFR